MSIRRRLDDGILKVSHDDNHYVKSSCRISMALLSLQTLHAYACNLIVEWFEKTLIKFNQLIMLHQYHLFIWHPLSNMFTKVHISIGKPLELSRAPHDLANRETKFCCPIETEHVLFFMHMFLCTVFSKEKKVVAVEASYDLNWFDILQWDLDPSIKSPR